MSEKSRATTATQGAGPLDAPSHFFVRWGTFLASGIVVLAALAAYHNSFSGPFILDDPLAITENPTIRHFQSALSPLHNGSGVDGRPMVNLSFAINYAAGGKQVWGYHAGNLAIHIMAGLALFGIVRRTLQQPCMYKRFGEAALPLACAVALLWTVHPLLTEAVTYTVQRNESLMGFFYLLTLYCFIRGTESGGQRPFTFPKATGDTEARGEKPEDRSNKPEIERQKLEGEIQKQTGVWLLACVGFCFLGTASKEVMVSAPLMVLLYDRAFVAGTFFVAWRQRWRLYLGLASTWLLLAHLMVGTQHRGNAVGFGLGIAWWEYALTQCHAIVHYLRLSFWPHPLIFDYGMGVVKRLDAVALQALILIMLVAGTLVGLWRWPKVGFVGIWFFAILSPSSSVVPNTTQTMAEHRMYLPLAAVIVTSVIGLYAWIGRSSLIIFAAAAVGLGCLTVQRNRDYKSALAIWSDTVAKCPGNERAHVSLGAVLGHIPGRLFDGIAECRAALQIKPDYPEAHLDMGNALSEIPGRLPDAMAEYKAALRINPGYADAHVNLGNALLRIPGHVPDAMAEYKAALRINPNFADAYYDVGCVLSQIPGRLPDAIAAYQAALRINPDLSEAHYNLGCALLLIRGRWPEAIAEFEAALQINPDYADAHVNLGYALLQFPGHVPDAMTHFETALQIRPDFKEVRQELDRLRANR